MRPFQTYCGGKSNSGVYQTLINEIPPHDVFVSGCLGNCSVMRKKKPAALNIGIDADKEVTEKWNEIKMASYSIYNTTFQEWVKNSLPDLIANNSVKSIFIFLDPPYPDFVRSSPRKIYSHEMMKKEEHIELLKLIRSIHSPKVMLMICSYPNDLYRNILHDWRERLYTGRTRRGIHEEAIYMNYPEPYELHDFRFLGADFRERERIRERIKRNVERLNKMHPLEASAIVSAIMESRNQRF